MNNESKNLNIKTKKLVTNKTSLNQKSRYSLVDDFKFDLFY